MTLVDSKVASVTGEALASLGIGDIKKSGGEEGGEETCSKSCPIVDSMDSHPQDATRPLARTGP